MTASGGAADTPPPRLAGLIGCAEEDLRVRLGEPDAARTVGEARWWTWSAPGWELRVRTVPRDASTTGSDAGDRAGAEAGAGGTGEEPERTVASWSLVWARGRETLRAAVEPLGLWPAAAPDATPGELELPLARRGIRTSEEGPERSLTVGVRAGAFVRVACFDEAPDWR